MTKRAFGDLEQQILSLFKEGARLTVKEVQSLLGGHDKYTTVMTVMQRLAEKQRLGRERVGLQYEYWVVKPLSLLEQLKKKFFGMKTSAVVNFLIESSDDISDEELYQLEKLIKEKRKK